MCATPSCSAITPARAFCSMPIRPELRPLYPPHWRELSRRVRFERAGGRCQGCGRPHRPASAACPMGAGSTRRPRLGAIAVVAWRDGPTWSRRPGSASPALCSRPRTWTAIPPTTGCATCARSASAATCCTTGRTTSRSGGSPTAAAGLWETCSSGTTDGRNGRLHDDTRAHGTLHKLPS